MSADRWGAGYADGRFATMLSVTATLALVRSILVRSMLCMLHCASPAVIHHDDSDPTRAMSCRSAVWIGMS